MKIAYLLILFFVIPQAIVGQCDSLKEASHSQSGSKQVDAMNAYAFCFMNSEFHKADSISNVALEKATLINYQMGIAQAKQNLGLVEVYTNVDQEKALVLLNEALHIFEAAGDSMEVAKVLGDIANANRREGDLGSALKNSIRGLSIFESNNFRRGISVYSANIGAIFMNTGDNLGAIPYYRKAIALVDTTHDRQNYAVQLGNLLAASISLGIEDSVNYYFKNVLRIQKEMGYHAQIAKTYADMQSYYEGVIDPENPIFKVRKAYADSAYHYATLSGDYLEISMANYYKGLLLSLEGNYVLSYPFLINATDFGEGQTMIKSEVAQAYFLRSEISNKAGDYEKSREELMFAYELNKEVNKDKIERSVAEVMGRYSLKQSQKELNFIKKEKLLAEKALEQSQIESERKDELAAQRQIVLYTIGTALLLAIIFGFMVFRAYRNKKESNKVITRQKEEAELQKVEINLQKKVVEERNKEITDSINYARRIQKAILPSEKIVEAQLPNSFVLYKPKDIVSGDFYWIEKQNDTVLFAVADCTGHGVPGAMVSVVCSNGLTRAVNEFGKTSPAEILDQTNDLVQQEFAKNKDRVADGMDIAICKLTGRTLTFAGANRPLWICRAGEIIEIEGDRKSIKSGQEITSFKEHMVELEPNDVVYLFSKGFVDQFGGEEGKKLKLSNLRRFVVAMHSFESFKQKVMINKAFEDWKGGMEQMDDVCMLGVKIIA